MKIWFFTVFHCFKILLGFGQVVPQNDDEPLSQRMSFIRDKHFTSGNYFSQRKMIDCSFEGGSFVGADFSYAFLTRCDFRNADLRGANFRYTELRECDFTGANIEGASFEGVEGSRGERVKRTHRGALKWYANYLLERLFLTTSRAYL